MESQGCPYCRQAEIAAVPSRWSLLSDVAAKGLGVLRIYLEIRTDDEFDWKKIGKALVSQDSLPVATEYDRRCPYCRRGNVTRSSSESIWPDAGARVLGLVRTYFTLTGDSSRPQLAWRELAQVFVEGEEAASAQVYSEGVEIIPPKPRRRRRASAAPEPSGWERDEIVDGELF